MSEPTRGTYTADSLRNKFASEENARAALATGAAIAAQCRILGMQAENTQRELRGLPPSYTRLMFEATATELEKLVDKILRGERFSLATDPVEVPIGGHVAGPGIVNG